MTEDYKKLAEEASKLNLKIKLDTLKLKKIKKELIDLMIERNVSKIQASDSRIIKSTWKSRFSTVLRKEFNKLEDKKKEEFFNKGLLKIQYKLDNKKYEELKNKQKKSELDQYIIDRKNIIFLTIRLTTKAKEMLNQSEIIKRSSMEEYYPGLEAIDLGDDKIIYWDNENDGEFDYEEWELEEEEKERLTKEEGGYDPGVARYGDDEDNEYDDEDDNH
jgi:hypothetical protein